MMKPLFLFAMRGKKCALAVISIIMATLIAGMCMGCGSAADQAKSDEYDTEKLSKTLVTTWEEFDNTEIPLIAAVPEADLYIYGLKPSGVLLCHNGKTQTFAWDYLTPRFILPEISIADFDNDNADEIAIILYIASGTGVAIEELHILEMGQNNSQSLAYIDHMFLSDEYIKLLDKSIAYSCDESSSKLVLEVNGRNNEYDLSAYSKEGATFSGIGYGNIVNFYFNNDGIKAAFAIGALFDTWVTPVYFGELSADVNYSSRQFSLGNYSFSFDSLPSTNESAK